MPQGPLLILQSHARQGQPIRRSWIEVPYGEEEITLLEEEVLPLVAQVLLRVEAIDRELQEQQQELEARIEAQRQAEAQTAGELVAP